MGDHFYRALCVRMDHGADVVIGAIINWVNDKLYYAFHREDTTADAVSLTGGNTLGGVVAQPRKWMEWGLDSYVQIANAPEYDITGAEYSAEWGKRKVNSFNSSLVAGLVSAILHNPVTARFLVGYGQKVHQNKGWWVTHTVATAGIPILINYLYMQRTGAWTYSESDLDRAKQNLQ